MSIQKGFPSNEREVSRDLPYKSDHITAQPVRKKQIAQDSLVHQFVRVVGTDTCEADCTTTILNLTAHSAQVGDIIRFTAGNLSGQEVKVIGITTDTVELGEILGEAPSTDTIQILRHKYPTVTDAGALNISLSAVQEDSAATSGDDITPVGLVRQDSLATDTSADGDYSFAKCNAEGEQYVTDETARTSLATIAGDTTSLDGKVTECNTGDVTVSSSALPTGAATAANQSTANSSLSTIAGDTTSIDSKVTACDTDNVTVASSALPTGAATETTLDAIKTAVEVLDNIVSGSEAQVDVVTMPDLKPGLDIVDQIDTTPLLDTSSSNIPASAGSPLEIVASTAAGVKKIQIVEDIGSFIGIYTGAAASEVLKAVLPLGGGEVELQIASGTRISLRAMENVAISSGKIAINFLG